MAQDTAGLIRALLNSGKISADTREDLEEFQREMAEGALDQADSNYVRALAERVLDGTEVGAAEEEWEEDDEDGEWEALEERAEAAESRVAELEAEVEALQSRIDSLEGELATLKGAGNEI